MILRIKQTYEARPAGDKFILDASVVLTGEERGTVEHFDLRRTLLENPDAGSGARGPGLELSLSVDDLLRGHRVDVTSLQEAITAQKALREAARILRELLTAAAEFEGEHTYQLGEPEGGDPAQPDAPPTPRPQAVKAPPKPSRAPRAKAPRAGPAAPASGSEDGLPEDSTINVRVYNGHHVIVHTQSGLYETQADGRMFKTFAEAKAHIDALASK